MCSCRDEILPDNGQSKNEQLVYAGEKVTRYLSFYLDMPGGFRSGETRDDGYKDGSASESNINNILLIFYTPNGDYITHYDSTTFTDELVKDDDVKVENIGWGSMVTISAEIFKSLENKPAASFFAVANFDTQLKNELIGQSITQSGDTTYNKLTDIKSITVDNFISYENNREIGHLMSSPGHFSTDDETYGKFIFYQEVPKDNAGNYKQLFYMNPSEAKNNPFLVYLERLAANVELELTKDISPIKVLYGTDVYSLNFNPGAWGLEAYEYDGYIAKNLNNKSSYNDQNAYSGRGNFSVWIEKSGGTSWAITPTFTRGKYAVKGDHSEYVTIGYFSFQNIDNKFYKSINNQGQTVLSGGQELFEHTFAVSEMDDATNAYAVPTSLVVKGYYTAKCVGTDEVEEDQESKHPTENASSENVLQTYATRAIGDTLNLYGAGFYLRYIGMERTDKATTNETTGNKDPKHYDYRLYRENNGDQDPQDPNKKNDLYMAMLKEQYVVFIKKVVTHEYKDENGNDQTDIITTYLPVNKDTKYKTGNKVTVKEKDPDTGEEKEIEIDEEKELAPLVFNIVNTQRRWLDPEFIDASNTYTLQLKNDCLDEIPESMTLYYGKYPDTDQGEYDDNDVADYIEISDSNSDSNIETVNKALQKQLGYAQLYYKAYAFFHAPIPHYTGLYNIYSSGYTGNLVYKQEGGKYAKDPITGKYLLDHKTGDFGIVRNHVYQFSIKSITKLGYGIPSEKHIPLPEPVIDHEMHLFDIEIKVLPWNQFEYQLDI